MEEHELHGLVQIAPFHPQFEFQGSGSDGIDNYTNRSPYPMFHILREDEVAAAVDKLGGDASKVWVRNVKLLERMEIVHIIENGYGSMRCAACKYDGSNILRDGQFIARLSDWGASFVYDRDSELAPIFERIEVLAFGHLVQDLFDWHLNTDVTNSKSLSLYDGLQNHLSKVWLHDLMNSILQPEQSKRPPFSKIKTSLSSIPEFAAAKISAEKLVSVRH